MTVTMKPVFDIANDLIVEAQKTSEKFDAAQSYANEERRVGTMISVMRDLLSHVERIDRDTKELLTLNLFGRMIRRGGDLRTRLWLGVQEVEKLSENESLVRIAQVRDQIEHPSVTVHYQLANGCVNLRGIKAAVKTVDEHQLNLWIKDLSWRLR